jgi:putative ABC transport system permease protein
VVIGVGIALGLGMTMMATSQASIDMLVGDFRISGANLYVHTEGGNLIPILPGEVPGKIRHARNVLSQIRGLPGVTQAFGTMTWPLERERPGPRRSSDEPTELLAVVGVDGDPSQIAGAVLLQAGRWLGRSDELVIGAKVAREKRLAIGDTVRLSGRDFQVVGIGRLRGVGFGSDGYAYMEYRALRQRADFGDVINMVAVETTRPDLARARIPELDTLAVKEPADLIAQAEKLLEVSLVMQAIMVGLTLVIAGLFVANMLGRSVTSRRVELATMRAIGVASRTILLLIAGEALFVSLLASAVGIAVSLTLGWLIDTYLAPMYGIESLYVVDAGVYLSVVLLALALGVLAGVVPARRATRVDPIDVLREA